MSYEFPFRATIIHDQPCRLQNVALIIGITSMVGISLAKILTIREINGVAWKVYGVGPCPSTAWNPIYPLDYIQCDISDQNDAESKLSKLTDITHIFYLRRTNSPTTEADGAMLRNVLRAVIPHASNLRHVSLQTSIRHYLRPLGWLDLCDKIEVCERPFTEEFPRSNTQEDILVEEIGKKDGLTWFINRPNVIFGFSPYSLMSLVGTLCVYAAICKHEGKPLWFPGTRGAWEGYSTASDADLIAVQHIWGVLSPNAKNMAFHCSNGDVFKWKSMWKVLVEQFGIHSSGFLIGSNYRLSELMKDKGPVWEEIVRKNHLRKTKLEEVANWSHADLILAKDPVLDSMNKAKEHGFWGFKNSKKSFLTWIREHKAHNIVP